jgi:hypothetical protein
MSTNALCEGCDKLTMPQELAAYQGYCEDCWSSRESNKPGANQSYVDSDKPKLSSSRGRSGRKYPKKKLGLNGGSSI